LKCPQEKGKEFLAVVLSEVLELRVRLPERILELRRLRDLVCEGDIPNLREQGYETGGERIVGQVLWSIFLEKDIQKVLDKKRVIKETLEA